MLLENTKIYAVLSKFDKYEQNRCRKYIKSPYFNMSEQLILLYEIIIKQINKSSKKELTKESIWKQLHKNRKYDDNRLRKYMSDLLKLTEGYLAQEFYELTPLASAMHFIKAIEKRKLNELYNTSIRNAKKLLSKFESLDANYFFHQYKIEDYIFEVANYEAETNEKTNYEKIMNNLDQFFLIEKLRIYCGILSKENQTPFRYRVNLIDEVIEYVERNLTEIFPSVEIYYRVYLTYIKEEDIENYQQLKTLMEIHSQNFPHEEAYHIYFQLINYCIKKIQLGQNQFYNELFHLYKSMISNEIIYENGAISIPAFKNIVTVATNLKEFSWVEEFIESNKDRLPMDQRDNLVTYNLARIFFTQKKYSDVIELLREVEYSDISLSLQSKTMLLMTYYDIDEFEPLDFLLESFRVYLNRHKEIPKNRIDYHKNLIKFTKKLTKVIPGDKEAVAKIKQEIEETEGFRVKWLEEKIAELES